MKVGFLQSKVSTRTYRAQTKESGFKAHKSNVNTVAIFVCQMLDENDWYAPCVAIVLEGTLQVSWFLEVIEGRMVGSLKESIKLLDV